MALNSESSIKLIDLLCEGPIEGLATQSNKSIFLDETSADQKAVLSSDFAIRKGTASQTRIGISDQFANATTTIIAVDTQVGENYSEKINENNQVDERKYGEGSLVKTITDPNANFVRLLFTIPKLFSTAVEGLARGQLFPAAIRIRISIKSKNSGFNSVTFDGQINVPIQANDIIKISKGEISLKLIQPPGIDFLSILREKLGWGYKP